MRNVWWRYAATLGLLAAVLLLVFFAFAAIGVPLLTDPSPWLQQGGWLAAALGIGLLIVDVVAPVPSSLVMVAHGAIFGLWLGTVCSVAGGLGAAAVGFGLGRRGGPLLARFVAADDQRQAQRLMQRWGPLAVIVSRPVPILAEAVAMLAGASGMGRGLFLASAFSGLLPLAVLYAYAGAVANTAGNTVAVFALTLIVAGLFWWAGRARRKES